MCGNNFGKKVAPFVLALTIGVFAGSILQEKKFVDKNPVKETAVGKIYYFAENVEIHLCPGEKSSTIIDSKKTEPAISSPDKKNVIVTSKPRAEYTDEARNNQIEGIVRLRVKFLANGRIGSIKPIHKLPAGLTEQAIEAARKIKFEPATLNGKPVSLARVVEYNFTIY